MSVWKEHMSVNRTVITLLGRTHVVVISDLSLMLMKGHVMVRKNNYLSHIIKQIYKSMHDADIYECTNGTHSCEQVCNNTHGSYHCLCFSGYQLNDDGFTCRGYSSLYTQMSEGMTQAFLNSLYRCWWVCHSGGWMWAKLSQQQWILQMFLQCWL